MAKKRIATLHCELKSALQAQVLLSIGLLYDRFGPELINIAHQLLDQTLLHLFERLRKYVFVLAHLVELTRQIVLLEFVVMGERFLFYLQRLDFLK